MLITFQRSLASTILTHNNTPVNMICFENVSKCVCIFGYARALVSFGYHHHQAHDCFDIVTTFVAALAQTRSIQAFDMHSNNKRALILNENRLEPEMWNIRQTTTVKRHPINALMMRFIKRN